KVKEGSIVWQSGLGCPIRQSPAFADGKVFLTAEDLKVRCFDIETGTIVWTSGPLAGQSARDYYPIVVQSGNRSFLIVRTNPILNMGQRIARDRTMLCRAAGIDDASWQRLEGWINSDASHGS